MRGFVIIALTAALSLIGCSDSPTGPTTSAVIIPPNPAPRPGTACNAVWPQCERVIWRATSIVVDVSATLNSCPVDNVVGQTRTVDWAIEQSPSSPSSILLFESAGNLQDPQDFGNYMGDPRTPAYYGSRTDDQFATVAEQDGQPTCFVWHGDLTGSFSADGRTFNAVENIKYLHFGEGDMVVRRHWTGIRQ